MEWCPKLHGVYGQTEELISCTQHQQIYKVGIFIDPSPKVTEDSNSLTLSLFDTLLHELCHAAFLLYGCKHTMNARTHLMNCGITGHSPLFFKLLRVILDAVEELKLDIDRKRAISLSFKFERKVLGKALRGDPSDLPDNDIYTLERAARSAGDTEGLYWN